MKNTLSNENGNFHPWGYWLAGIALIAGLVLSVLSWLELCVQHCSANQDYRLFGLPFAWIGIPFFAILTTLHFLSRQFPGLTRWVILMLASALGAEIMFIAVQKYQIGHLCPVCLSIATAIFIAVLPFLIYFLRNFIKSIQLHNRGEIMQNIKRALSTFSFFVFGFLMAFIGVSKPDLAEAAMNEMKNNMAFGNKNSPVEVYFITDWYCPSCRKVEPLIEKAFPEITSKAAFYFIDYPIHKKSLNFTPYNLSFLVHNQQQYFKARRMLTDLSERTESPKEEEISKAAKKLGISYKSLPFIDVKSGLDFFEQIGSKYKIHATPTVVITNPHRNTTVILEGRDEISKEKILNAIKKMTPSS